MDWGCQDVTQSPSSLAAGTRSQWSMQMDPLSILGSQSADQLGRLRNLEDSSGSLDLHPSLPNAPVQDLRGPTSPGAGTLDLKGAATARTGAVLSPSRHLSWVPSRESLPPREHSLKLLIQSWTRTRRGSPRSSLQGLQDFIGPYTHTHRASSIPQRFPSPAGRPTLPQGAQGRVETALSQPVRPQGVCVPNGSDPCPLPACFTSPRRRGRG